ncbi:MAG: hypothetical protein IPQ07_27720 [Myxococcales bacterium]|nr:hypothetical protein [Myxococcales bacterium]
MSSGLAFADEPPTAPNPPVDPQVPGVSPTVPEPAQAPAATGSPKHHKKHDHEAGSETTTVTPPGEANDETKGEPEDEAKAEAKAQAKAERKAKGQNGQKKKKKKKKLEFGGRLFVRGAVMKAAPATDWTGQGSVTSARAKADFRSHGMHAELQVEFAGKARLKNAYIQLPLVDGPARIDVRAGQFKMPFSAIERESLWSLPTADRGLLHDVLAKRLQVAGRSVGAMIIVELPGDVPTKLEAGVFQGFDDAGTPLASSSSDRFGQDLVLRASVKPVHGFEIGAAGEARVGQLLEVPVVIRRGYAAEVDATIEATVGPGLLRFWLEGMIGTSWLVGGMSTGHELTRFLETRGVVAYRIGGENKHRYGELYAQAGALDPDRIISGDRLVEIAGGLTYGLNDVWRVQAEAEVWRVADAAPLGIAQFAVAPGNTTTILVQLGARL